MFSFQKSLVLLIAVTGASSNVEAKSVEALKSIIPPMTEALKAKEVKRRRYAAHTVMLFGHRVKDSSSLTPLVQPLVAAHFHDSDARVRVSAGMALKTTFGQIPNP